MDDVPFFDLREQLVRYKPEIMSDIEKVIDSGQFISGQEVKNFEQKFAEFNNAKHCVALGNGLDALRLSLEALGIGAGDEVIVPGFTFYATWLAVIQAGAKPVPVDVEIQSANIDVSLIEAAISSKTRAVLVVHLYGFPADLEEISNLCKKNDLYLLEDSAQSHGATRNNIKVGSWGTVGSFSFYPTKNLGALGDAGCIVTDNDELAQKVKSRRSYGQGTSKYDHVDFGWNSRMDEIQASILLRHLTKLDSWTDFRKQIAKTYVDALGERIEVLVGAPAVENSVWHHFIIKVKNRAEVIRWFANKGITTDIHYPYYYKDLHPLVSLHREDELLGFNLPNSKLLSNSVLSMPIGPWMNPNQIARVADAIHGLPSEYCQFNLESP